VWPPGRCSISTGLHARYRRAPSAFLLHVGCRPGGWAGARAAPGFTALEPSRAYRDHLQQMHKSGASSHLLLIAH
jgi:hypothetical protein